MTANQLYPAIILEDYAELSSDSNEDAEVEESPTNSGLLEAQVYLLHSLCKPAQNLNLKTLETLQQKPLLVAGESNYA